MNRFRSLVLPYAGSLAIASGLLLLLEGAASVWERYLVHPQNLGFATRTEVVMRSQKGERIPDFLVSDAAGSRVGNDYTNGEHCYPFHCQSVPKVKNRNEFWIACFGGSTTNGIDLISRRKREARGVGGIAGLDLLEKPWPGEEPFCSRVAAKIQAAQPGLRVRPFNFGGDIFDSRGILPIMEQLARRPSWDLWLVYWGHNEFMFRQDLLEPLHTAARFRQRLLEGSALFRGFGRLHMRATQEEVDGRVRQHPSVEWIETEGFTARRAQTLVDYEARSRRVVELGREHGFGVVFSELVHHLAADMGLLYRESDVMLKAYARNSTSNERATLARLTREARDFRLAGDLVSALSRYRRIMDVDPRYCTGVFGVAETLIALGRREEALAAYEHALREARLPVVATPEQRQAIGRVGSETQTPVARVWETFTHRFLNDPTDYGDLFLDDVHPTAAGHEIIAEAMVEAWAETSRESARQ